MKLFANISAYKNEVHNLSYNSFAQRQCFYRGIFQEKCARRSNGVCIRIATAFGQSIGLSRAAWPCRRTVRLWYFHCRWMKGLFIWLQVFLVAFCYFQMLQWQIFSSRLPGKLLVCWSSCFSVSAGCFEVKAFRTFKRNTVLRIRHGRCQILGYL